MAKNTDSPMLDLGLVTRVNVPTRGLFSTRRLFRCPPGFNYSVFRQTSAGPEFVESYGPNESGNLDKNEELYRISIGGAPTRYAYRESYSFVDGTVIELDTELFVKVTDGARVTRLVIQDRQDPLRRLQDDIRWLLEEELGKLDYAKVFFPKTREIRLDTRSYGERIEQKAQTGDYGLEITKVRTRLILPPELKQRWEADIAEWQEIVVSEIEKEKIEKRRKEAELTKEIAQLDVDATKLETELDQELEKIRHEQELAKTRREWTKEDEAREREYQLRLDEEAARQAEITSETRHQIEVRETEQAAELAERQRAEDFDLDRERIKQRHQLRLEAERRLQERGQQLEQLRHQVSTDSLIAQIEQSRRKQAELEKVHQLRLQRLEELAKLRYDRGIADQRLEIQRLEEEQKLLLTSGQRKADLKHQWKVLDYEEAQAKRDLQVERARQMDDVHYQERLARIELGKELVRARLAMLDRVATGESSLTPEQIDRLIGIDPMKDREMTPERIAHFMDALNEFLTRGGVEEIREALDQLSALKQPALPKGEGETGDSSKVQGEAKALVSDDAEGERVEAFAIAQIKDHEIDAPLVLGQEYTLLTGISKNIPSDFPGEGTPVQLPDVNEIEINVAVRAEGMDILPHWRQQLKFFQGHDSDLLEFILIPQEVGHQQIEIEFYYQQHWLTGIKLEVEVVEEPEMMPEQRQENH